MSRGAPTPLVNHYVFDLESCDNDLMIGEDYPSQRSWLSGYMNLATYQQENYTDLKDCLSNLFKKGGNQKIEIGVHNLSFDGSFICPVLVELGYKPTELKPKRGEFSVLVDERNSWYSIRVQVSDKRQATFWDTAKLFPMPLKYLHEVYHTPTKKIKESEEFYNTIRELDHIPTEQELDYFHNDLQVLAEVINAHIKYVGLDFKKTQASQAFYNFEQSFKAWRLRFPALSLEHDKAIRVAYWGGISYPNPLHQGKIIKDVIAMDENSAYPYFIANERLPYGKMQMEYSTQHPYMGMFWVAKAIVEFKLKENCVPCIAKKAIADITGIPKGVKWVEDSHGLVELTFSCIDYLTFKDSYYFKVVAWQWSYHWAWKKHPELKRFVDTNNDIKIKHRGLANTLKEEHADYALIVDHLAKAQRAKIDNNAFYGKFGEDIVKLGKVPYLDEDDVFRLKEDRMEIVKPYKRKYLPVAIATTAYARRAYITLVNLLGEDFIYGDTDSCYFRAKGLSKVLKAKQDGVIRIDTLELGAWAIEGEYDLIKVLRPKTYLTIKKGDKTKEVTLAGLPADEDAQYGEKKRECITLDNFEIGTVIKGGNGKLRTVWTPTGKKLVPTDFEIGANTLIDF